MDLSKLKSDITNPQSSTFKYMIGTIVLLVVIYLLKRYQSKRAKYHQQNPVFFQQGVDPKKKTKVDGSKFLKSSNGNECTFFFWMYVDNFVYKYGQWKDVFIKGRPGDYKSQCPGIFINKKKNALRFEVSTMTGIDVVTVDDFPIRKWFSSAIVIKGTQVEIYRDAMLVKTQNLSGNMRENSGPLHIGNYGGYAGNLSCIHYFSKAIGSKLIQWKHKQGPMCYPWWQKMLNKIKGVTANVAGSIKIDIDIDLDAPKWSAEKSGQICIGKKITGLGKTDIDKAKDAALKQRADCISYATKGSSKGHYNLYKNSTSGKRTGTSSSFNSVLLPRKQDSLNKKIKKPKMGGK